MKKLLSLVLLLPCSVFADRIIFVDGMELEGTILKELETEYKVEVAYGTVNLLKSRIQKVELKLDERLAKIEKTDTAGFLELAALCEKYGDERGLMGCLAAASENEDIPPQRLEQLAGLYEKHGMRREMKIALARYLELNPGRQDIADRLDKLEKGETPKKPDAQGQKPEEAIPQPEAQQERPAAEPAAEVKPEPAEEEEAPAEVPIDATEAKKPEGEGGDAPKPAVGKTETPAPAVEAAKPDTEKKEEGDEEGYEANKNWQPQSWGNPCEFEVVDQGGEKKNLIARVTFNKTDKDKAAIRLDHPCDLSKYKAISFDAFNGSERSIRIAVAVTTLPGWGFFESYATTIKSGNWATKRMIELDKQNFKSRASNWEYTTAIENKSNTAQIMFLIYHNMPQGHIFLDNIRFVEGGGDVEAAPEDAEE